MDKYQYQLLEPNDDYRSAKIEKTGITAVFTIADIENDEGRGEGMQKEIEGQLKIEKATMENIEHFHPFVKDLTDEQLSTAALYWASKSYVIKAEPKLEEVKQALVEMSAEKDHIMQLLGFVPTHEEPTTQA